MTNARMTNWSAPSWALVIWALVIDWSLVLGHWPFHTAPHPALSPEYKGEGGPDVTAGWRVWLRRGAGCGSRRRTGPARLRGGWPWRRPWGRGRNGATRRGA